MTQHKTHYALACCLLLGMGFAASAYGQESCSWEQTVLENVLEGREVLEVGHVTGEAAYYTKVSTDALQQSGSIEPYPSQLSEEHQEAIMQARAYYLEEDYAAAAAVLEPAYAAEPENPFILNEYARALYWRDEEVDRSRGVYRELVRGLDAEGTRRLGDGGVYIDAWFVEAYWKLGTLYLDSGANSLGIYEISRALLGTAGHAAPAFLEQAFAFLADAYLQIGQNEEAHCFADQVLKLNPQNEEMRAFVAHLKQKK